LMEGHFLPAREFRRHLRAEYEALAEARHPLLLEYASGLAEHGYTVLGVPDLRIDPKMDVFQRVNLDFGFCNVLPGLRRSQASVHHFVSGVRKLDADATDRIRLAGVEPVVVSTAEVASALMLLRVTLDGRRHRIDRQGRASPRRGACSRRRGSPRQRPIARCRGARVVRARVGSPP